MKIVDTHAHLFMPPLIDDIDNVLNIAKSYNVVAIFNQSDSLQSMDQVLQLQDKYPNLCYSTLGIFPTFALSDDSYFETAYKKIIDNKDRIKAIGEIGLDYSTDEYKLYKDKQKYRFIQQIQLAKKLNLPIVVHSRDASEDTYNIIKEELPPIVDLHCFSQSVEMLKKYLSLPIKFYIGVGGILTFKNAKNIIDVVNSAPLDIILTETDSPYLTPIPFRGKPNNPGYIKYVIEKIAQIKETDVEKCAELLFNNAKLFYNL